MSKKFKKLCGVKLDEPLNEKQYVRGYYVLHRKLAHRQEWIFCKKMVLNLESHQNSFKDCKTAKALLGVPKIDLKNFSINFGIWI